MNGRVDAAAAGGATCKSGTPGARGASRLALLRAIAITAIFFVIEVIGGLLSGSLALLADAGHMASDLAALLFAYFALRISERQATPEKSYGYVRTEILAALANGTALVLVSLYVMAEAISRFGDPPEVRSGLMLWVAVAGLLANLASAAVLFGARKQNLNIRGAFLHVLGDTLGSIGAITAAVLMQTYGWARADAVVAFGIAGLILLSAWHLLRESVDILMESTPRHVDLVLLQKKIFDVPGVSGIEDLHVWTLTSGFDAMSAHIVVMKDADGPETLQRLTQLVRDSFGISHTTFQLEVAGDDDSNSG